MSEQNYGIKMYDVVMDPSSEIGFVRVFVPMEEGVVEDMQKYIKSVLAWFPERKNKSCNFLTYWKCAARVFRAREKSDKNWKLISRMLSTNVK